MECIPEAATHYTEKTKWIDFEEREKEVDLYFFLPLLIVTTISQDSFIADN